MELNGYQKDCITMNRYGHERVHLWADTQVVVETGGYLLLDQRKA